MPQPWTQVPIGLSFAARGLGLSLDLDLDS